MLTSKFHHRHWPWHNWSVLNDLEIVVALDWLPNRRWPRSFPKLPRVNLSSLLNWSLRKWPCPRQKSHVSTPPYTSGSVRPREVAEYSWQCGSLETKQVHSTNRLPHRRLLTMPMSWKVVEQRLDRLERDSKDEHFDHNRQWGNTCHRLKIGIKNKGKRTVLIPIAYIEGIGPRGGSMKKWEICWRRDTIESCVSQYPNQTKSYETTTTTTQTQATALSSKWRNM